MGMDRERDGVQISTSHEDYTHQLSQLTKLRYERNFHIPPYVSESVPFSCSSLTKCLSLSSFM